MSKIGGFSSPQVSNFHDSGVQNPINQRRNAILSENIKRRYLSHRMSANSCFVHDCTGTMSDHRTNPLSLKRDFTRASELRSHMSAELPIEPNRAPGGGLTEAIYFDSGERQLFGWLHLPKDA